LVVPEKPKIKGYGENGKETKKDISSILT
jgi:hypothetical protein